jgi:hypothetical protein
MLLGGQLAEHSTVHLDAVVDKEAQKALGIMSDDEYFDDEDDVTGAPRLRSEKAVKLNFTVSSRTKKRKI